MELVRQQFPKKLLLIAGIISMVTAIVVLCTSILPHIPLPNGSQPPVPSPAPLPQLKKHEGLEHAKAPELRKLAEYEALYGGITDQLMIFSDTPTTTEEASDYATDMAEKLKEFASFDITPLIIFEPIGPNGPLNLEAYRSGGYDNTLRHYFTSLKKAGITNSTLGNFVVFAEANTPAWQSSTNPDLIAACITKTARLQKEVFPSSKTWLLLDSKTYITDDTAWEHGEFKSLLPYVKNIPDGLVDSFGLQGFPWAAPANDTSGERLFNPHQYLDANFATEAAKELKIKNIWFNSGTFSRIHTESAAHTLSVSADQRQQLLSGVLKQATEAAEQGFDVTFNLFSANKADTGEATDWSYQRSSDDQQVFRSFVTSLRRSGIMLSLFDSLDPR